MSNSSLPKSLISAYFDGEVTAEERASVSRAAEKSSAVQQTLDDYHQLSGTLTALRDGISSPGLRGAVMAQITGQSMPTAIDAITPVTPIRRRQLAIVGAVLAVSAAALILAVWPGDQSIQPGVRVAQNDESRPMAHRASPSLDGLSVESGMAAVDADVAPEESHPTVMDVEAVKVASIPDEWFTQQHAKDRRPPQPGDVMNYLIEVAEETVIIPVTVVDVQRTAGQIRLLLSRHGIQPLSPGGAAASDAFGESSVAILVESDWDQLPSVMDALDTQGLDVARYVESSPAARRAIVEQNLLDSAESSDTQGDAVARTESAGNGPGTTFAREAAPLPDELNGRLTSVLRGMFFEAPVTAEFVEEIEQRQQALADSPGEAIVADSTPSELSSTADAESSRADDPARRIGAPLARKAPARMVFLIKKSGQAP